MRFTKRSLWQSPAGQLLDFRVDKDIICTEYFEVWSDHAQPCPACDQDLPGSPPAYFIFGKGSRSKRHVQGGVTAVHPILTPATGSFDRPLTRKIGGVSHRLMHFDSAVIAAVNIVKALFRWWSGGQRSSWTSNLGGQESCPRSRVSVQDVHGSDTPLM